MQDSPSNYCFIHAASSCWLVAAFLLSLRVTWHHAHLSRDELTLPADLFTKPAFFIHYSVLWSSPLSSMRYQQYRLCCHLTSFCSIIQVWLETDDRTSVAFTFANLNAIIARSIPNSRVVNLPPLITLRIGTGIRLESFADIDHHIHPV